MCFGTTRSYSSFFLITQRLTLAVDLCLALLLLLLPSFGLRSIAPSAPPLTTRGRDGAPATSLPRHTTTSRWPPPFPTSSMVSDENSESTSRSLVNFGVLNNNLITCLISCVKCINMFLMKVQMYSLIHHLKYNYKANGTMRSTCIVNQ
jgi:hypothetical protein